MKVSTWKEHLRLLAALGTALATGIAIADDDGYYPASPMPELTMQAEASPASSLGTPSLARPSKLKLVTPAGEAVSADIPQVVQILELKPAPAAGAMNRTASRTAFSTNHRETEASGGEQVQPETMKLTLRPTRVKPAADQSGIAEKEVSVTRTSNITFSPANNREAKRKPDSKGNLAQPKRLRVQPVAAPPTETISHRRTAIPSNVEAAPTTEIPLGHKFATQGTGLVAAYRANQSGDSRQAKIVAVPEDLKPKLAQLSEEADATEEITVEAPGRTKIVVIDQSTLPNPIDVSDPVPTVTAEGEYLAPIISSADLPRPGIAPKSPETRVPLSLPKPPAVPSVHTARRVVSEVVVTEAVPSTPAKTVPEVTTSKETENELPPEKSVETATKSENQDVGVSKETVEAAAERATAQTLPGRAPARLSDSLQGAKKLLPDWSDLKRALGTKNQVAPAEKE